MAEVGFAHLDGQQGSLTVSRLGGCDRPSVREALRVDANVALDAAYFLPAS